MQEKSTRLGQADKSTEKPLRNSIEETTPTREDPPAEDILNLRGDQATRPKGDSTRNKGKKP